MDLEEKKLEVQQTCEKAKVLYMKAGDLDLKVAKFVHQLHSGIFERYVEKEGQN